MKITRNQLTDDQIVEHASRFTSKSKWEAASKEFQQRGLPSPYKCALRRGIFGQATRHMTNGKRSRKITDDEIIRSAAEFTSIKSWREKFNNLYSLASHRNLLERATAHMVRLPSPYSGSYQVYAYEFGDRSVYVGLTCFPEKRHLSHLLMGPVYDHVKVAGTPHLVVKHSEIKSPDEARQLESLAIRDYAQAGFTILNVAPAGSLGSAIRWTRSKIEADALRYRTRSSWMASSIGAYVAARRLGIFDEVTSHMPKRAKSEKALVAFLVIGVPGSGKTWVVNQLSGYTIVRYDDDHFSFSARVHEALTRKGTVVCETGFRYRELLRTFAHVKFNVAVIDLTPEQVFDNLRRRGGGDRFDRDKCQKRLVSLRRFGQRCGAFIGTAPQVLEWIRVKTLGPFS